MFYAVAAAVLGGTAMLGGAGTIIGAFLGALLLAIFTDGFAIIGVNANPLFIVFGLRRPGGHDRERATRASA